MQAHTIDGGDGCHALVLRAIRPVKRDPQGLLWLLLPDGAVRAFRLPLSACSAPAIEDLAAQSALDWAGKTLAFTLKSADPVGFSGQTQQAAQAHALYAAPVSPTANTAAWTACARWLAWSAYAGEVMDAPFAREVFALPNAAGALGIALLGWSRSLDGESLRVLNALASDRVYASCRNYTRLMRATPTLRRNRLQALAHYPNQLAHVLLSPHHGYDLQGDSAHAWRLHEPALEAAVDAGGSLLAVLARSCQVDKSVFKAQALRENWPTLALSRARLLQVLQGIPAPMRPADSGDLVQAQALWQWLQQHDLTDTHTLRAIGSGFLNKGIAPLLAKLQQWTHQGVFSWTELDDFVRQVQLWEDRQNAPQACLPPQRSVLRAWLQERGLWDLHKAAGRWHAALPDLLTQRRIDTLQIAHTLQAPLRQLCWALQGASWQAQLLETADALRLEGTQMRHCVATYWRECVEEGSRIFSVRNVASEVAAIPPQKPQHRPRVTVQYRLALEQSGYVYQLAQVRGHRNRLPDASLQAASFHVCEALNAPELAEVRNTLGREVQMLQFRRQELERGHAVGYWGAEALLDDTSLAHLAQLIGLPGADATHKL